jgi:serine/threonine protein phosphatase PrpC
LKKKREHIFDSIIGLEKLENQDNLLIIEQEDYSLYFIFDGVGSSINSIIGTKLSKSFINDNHSDYFSNGYFEFSKLLFNTNNFLLDQDINDVKTTYCSICLTHLTPNKFQYSSLGDSRIYLSNQQFLIQITKDDRYLTNQNIITKCLGMRNLLLSDFYTEEYKIADNEKILLCTDGFYNLLEKEKFTFFNTFNMVYLASIKRKISKLVEDKNIDDATYIMIK